MSIAQAVYSLTAPFLVGTALSTFLCGVTVAQCCTYFTTFRNDRPIFRLSVAILLLIDLTHTAFCQVTLWLWFVIHYGEPTELASSPWTFAFSPILCGVTTLVVQLFYAYRLWLISDHRPFIPSLIVFGSLWQLGWSAGATWQIFVLRYFADFHVWTYGVACWLGGAAANDLLITSSLIVLLISSKSASTRPNNVIDRLISLTIESNGLTFTVALLDLITFAACDGAYHVIPNLCIIKLYINSFLVTLNTRSRSHIPKLEIKESTRDSDGQSTTMVSDQMGREFVKLDVINRHTSDNMPLVTQSDLEGVGVTPNKRTLGNFPADNKPGSEQAVIVRVSINEVSSG